MMKHMATYLMSSLETVKCHRRHSNGELKGLQGNHGKAATWEMMEYVLQHVEITHKKPAEHAVQWNNPKLKKI